MIWEVLVKIESFSKISGEPQNVCGPSSGPCLLFSCSGGYPVKGELAGSLLSRNVGPRMRLQEQWCPLAARRLDIVGP